MEVEALSMIEDVAAPFAAPGEAVDYPTRDGRPMGESDVHREQMVDLIQALEAFFAGQPDVYVSGNLMFYYEEGNPQRHVSPDVMVVHGVPSRKRDLYKLWEEGSAPSLVFEITSRSTRSEDLGLKKGLYEFLRVREYVLFDPREEYLEPRLRIYRLEETGYRLLEPGDDLLETVGLRAVEREGQLRLEDPGTGRVLPTRRDLEARLREAEERAARAERELERREEG